jgi:tRNA A-37 threonylcarbamoyl transferase component Bud32
MLAERYKGLVGEGLENPARLIEESPEKRQYIGKDKKARVVGIRLRTGLRTVVKRFRHSQYTLMGKLAPEHFFVGARTGKKSFRMGQRFLEKGVLTPEPIALVEKRVFGLWKKMDLYTVEELGLVSFSRFLRETAHAKGRKLEERRKTIAWIGEAVKNMHAKGLVMGDLTLVNIWLRVAQKRAPVVFFGDLDKAKEKKRLTEKDIVGELAKLNSLLRKDISRGDRLRFWRAYAKDNPLLAKPERYYWKKIEVLSEKRRKARARQTQSQA